MVVMCWQHSICFVWTESSVERLEDLDSQTDSLYRFDGMNTIRKLFIFVTDIVLLLSSIAGPVLYY